MRILKTSDRDVGEAAREAAAVLRAGGIALYPTDTLYGLAVDARDPDAVARLNALKGRGSEKYLSVVVSNIDMLARYAEVTEAARRLIDAHLPGPLTLVLPIKGTELAHLAPDGALGVRIPDDPFTNVLSDAFGAPYTATSANLAGLPTEPSVDKILAQFGAAQDRIDLVIDDGPRRGGVPSTVVRATGNGLEILREGALSHSELGLDP